MASLTINLEEGFENDLVEIRLGGKQVYSNPRVRTRLQIGLADSFVVEMDGNEATMEISLPKKHISKSISVRAVTSNIYLRVWISEEGRIEHEEVPEDQYQRRGYA